MALLDDILGQLEQLGLSTDYMGISGLTPESISEGLSSSLGVSQEFLPSSLFQPISTESLQKGLFGQYSPMIQSQQTSLYSDLTSDLGGETGRKAAGGFAGSGQLQKFGQQARDVYGKGMGDVLGKAGQEQSRALGSIQDMINQWRQTALQIKGQGE